jgi:hypothetical protein
MSSFLYLTLLRPPATFLSSLLSGTAAAQLVSTFFQSIGHNRDRTEVLMPQIPRLAGIPTTDRLLFSEHQNS